MKNNFSITYRRRYKNKLKQRNMKIYTDQEAEKENMKILREATRAEWNQKTLHGIPRNYRTAKNFQQVIEMQENLSQGHKTVEHEDAHSPLFQHFEQKSKNQRKV